MYVGTGGILYSSGSVAAGAVIESPVLDISNVAELLILIDNTAGSVFRDLSMLTYLDDGTTLVDSCVIRRCAFGAAPDGATHAPGRIRGFIGAGASVGSHGVHVLYDKTSAADGVLDTGNLVTEGMSGVHVSAVTSAGTTTLATYGRDDAGNSIVPVGTTTAASGVPSSFTGVGTTVSTGVIQALSMSPHRRMRYYTTTAGGGNTVRLLVNGTGPVPGSFAHAIPLPTRASFSLAAAGAAAARMTIIGR